MHANERVDNKIRYTLNNPLKRQRCKVYKTSVKTKGLLVAFLI